MHGGVAVEARLNASSRPGAKNSRNPTSAGMRPSHASASNTAVGYHFVAIHINGCISRRSVHQPVESMRGHLTPRGSHASRASLALYAWFWQGVPVDEPVLLGGRSGDGSPRSTLTEHHATWILGLLMSTWTITQDPPIRPAGVSSRPRESQSKKSLSTESASPLDGWTIIPSTCPAGSIPSTPCMQENLQL